MSWDMSSVTNMSGMFSGASSFTQDISTWDTSSAENLENMFSGATSFSQDISDWNLGSAQNVDNMFTGATTMQEGYNIGDTPDEVFFPSGFSPPEAESENVFGIINHAEVPKQPLKGEPIIENTNNAIIAARAAMPTKEITSDSSNYYSLNRNKFVRTIDTSNHVNNEYKYEASKKWYGNYGSGEAISGYRKRRLDFSKSILNIQGNEFSSTNNYKANDVNQSLQRTRAGGATVPSKVVNRNI